MYSVELMEYEHKNILKMIEVIRNICCGILEGKDIIAEDFIKIIDFTRNYADKHHHGKEEYFLFEEMTNQLGKIGENLIQHGMLVEHDLGRLYIQELESALLQYQENPKSIHKLGIIAGAAGYANLLQRHISKENEVIFTFAKKNLPSDILDAIDLRVKEFERKAKEEGTPEKYLQIMEELEEKYL